VNESNGSACLAKLALLDVGHGCAAVVYGGKEAVVFDCPPGLVLPKFLIQHGVAVVRHLIISHGDKDHMGGVAALINSGIAVERIWLLDDQENNTMHYQQVAKAFAAARAAGNRRLSRHFPHSDATAAEWGNFAVEWIGPNHEDRMLPGDRNSLSVIARLVLQAKGIALFTGDVTYNGLAQLDAQRDWSADWLIAPHHGGLCGTPKETQLLIRTLLDRTNASSVYFSFSRDRYNLPLDDVVNEIASRGPRISIRCSQLSRACSPSLNYSRDSLGVVAQGAQEQPIKCCAGSVLVTVSSSGDIVFPGAPRHDELVRQFPDRLCRPRS
jgi:beta-lactamase superfamily II metal-dependent hydrolase